MILVCQRWRGVWRAAPLCPVWELCWVFQRHENNQFKYEQVYTILQNVYSIYTYIIIIICLFGIIGGSQFQSSAPVNIPGSFSSSAPFSSPSPSPPIRTHASPFFSTHLSQPGQSESTFLGPSHSSLGLWNLIQDIKCCSEVCMMYVWFC